MAKITYEIEVDDIDTAIALINDFVELGYGGNTVNVLLPLDTLARADLEKYQNE